MIHEARNMAIKSVWEHIADRHVELKSSVRFSQTVDTDLTSDYVIKHFDLERVYVSDITNLDLMELENAEEHEWGWSDIPTRVILTVLGELEGERFTDYDD